MKNFLVHQGVIDYLRGAKLLDGKFDNKTLASLPLPEGVPKRATIIVRPMAYAKMIGLIMGFSTEVGWQGICHRDPENDSVFIIEDVMVYPQNVTGTTITTDEKRQTEWLDALDDETFKQLRFHGHSHVNMGVFSSGTDDDLQRDLTNMLVRPDDFYLFFIMNKRLELFVRLYDNKFGVVYERNDVDVCVTDGVSDLGKFMTESKAQVTTTYYTPPATNPNCKTNNTSQPSSSQLPPQSDKTNASAGSTQKQSSVYAGHDYDDDYDDDDPYGYYDGRRWVACEGRYAQ